MIDIVLYRFAKKVNSTARPTSSTTQHTFSCLIREGSSIINPYIELQATTQNIHRYNYCYIPTFNRYYFISDIVYSNNVWQISCRVDVLATYYTQIGSSSQYILRSSSEFNGAIIDTNYPVSVQDSHSVSSLVNSVMFGSTAIQNYFDRTIETGMFVFGVIGENSGGISYYAIAYTPFKEFMNALMAFTPTDMTDVSTGVAKQLADPLQYITSCYWFPYVPYDTANRINYLMLGRFRINTITAYKLDISQYKGTFTQEITLPKHPDMTDRGAYLCASPYTDYTLIFQPFGSMVIKEPDIAYHTRLKLWWSVDFTTGNSYLTVRYSDDADTCLAYQTSQYGIPIHLAQAVVDYLGVGTSILDTAASLIDGGGSFVSGMVTFFEGKSASRSIDGFTSGLSGLAHGISGAGHGIANALQAAAPKISTTGTQGSFLQQTRPVLYATFHRPVNENNDIFGKPLCATRTINTLSGYVQVSSPQVSIAGITEWERSMLIQFMGNGFYYTS